MNPVTLPIYDRSSIVDLSPASIQLAITQRVELMVFKKTNDANRASGSVYVSNAGRIILGIDAHAAFDEISDSGLIDSIRSWNTKRNTTELNLDAVTVEMARLIEMEFAHPLGDHSITRANITAQITTECDSSVIKNDRVADNTTTVLVDQTTGKPVYLGNSDTGKQLSAQIKHSLQHNQSGNPDVYIIQAPQGAGKTNWLTQLISDTNQDDNHILCLSPRQQITASLFNDVMKMSSVDPNDVLIGASLVKHTHTHKRQRPADEYHITLTTINSMERIWKFIDERPRLIDRLIDQALQDEISEQEYLAERKKLDQLSVTGNIFSSVPNQDLIVCDEFQLLRSSIVGGTHITDDQAFTIRRYMSHLEQQSKAIVVLDADLDASVVEYFTLNHPNSTIHISKCIVPERREVYLHQDTDSLMCWLIDQIKMIDVINRAEVTAPASFAIPCTSTTSGRLLKRMINHIRPDLNVLWIEAKNKGDTEQQKVLQNPSLACNYDIVIYSPKIFTGFSFDPVIIGGRLVPVADVVVGLFSGRKITWNERSQALFRIRNCMEFHFSVCDTESDSDEDETITKDEIRRFRETTLFDCDGLRIPLPKAYYANDNMIRQFRARGFELFDQPTVDGASKRLSNIKRAMNVEANQPTQPNPVTVSARGFVDLLIQKCGLGSDLSPGHYTLFSGKLRDGFSLILDQLLEEYPKTSDWISVIIPKWKRNFRYDVATVQKMFTAANNNLELVVDRSNMVDDGVRCNVFHMTLVVHPIDLHV